MTGDGSRTRYRAAQARTQRRMCRLHAIIEHMIQLSRGWAAWFLWGTRAEGALCYGAGEGLTGGVVQTGTGKRVVGGQGAQIA